MQVGRIETSAVVDTHESVEHFEPPIASLCIRLFGGLSSPVRMCEPHGRIPLFAAYIYTIALACYSGQSSVVYK